MATISFNVPDAIANRVLNAIATKYGFTGFLADGVTPQTKTQFYKQWVINSTLAAIKEQEGNTLAATAINNNNTDINSNILIT